MPKVQKENKENVQNLGNKDKKRTPLIDKTNSFGNSIETQSVKNKKINSKIKSNSEKKPKDISSNEISTEEDTIYDTVKRRKHQNKPANLMESKAAETSSKTPYSLRKKNVEDNEKLNKTPSNKRVSYVKQLFKKTSENQPPKPAPPTTKVAEVKNGNIKSPLSDNLSDAEILRMLESDAVLPTPPKILSRKDMNKRTMLNCLLKKNVKSSTNHETPGPNQTIKRTKKKVELKVTPNKIAKENQNPDIPKSKSKDPLPVYLQPRESTTVPKPTPNRPSECLRLYDFPEVNDPEKSAKGRKAPRIMKIIRKRKPTNKPRQQNLEPLNEDLIFKSGPKFSFSNFCPPTKAVDLDDHHFDNDDHFEPEPEMPVDDNNDFLDFDEAITNANVDSPARITEKWRADLPMVLRPQLFETKKGSIVPNFSDNNLDMSMCNSKLMHSLITHNTSHHIGDTDEILAANKTPKQSTLDSYLQSRNTHQNAVDFSNVVTSSPSAKRILTTVDTNRMSPSLFGFDDDDDTQTETEQRLSKKPTRISVPKSTKTKQIPEEVPDIPPEDIPELTLNESDNETESHTENFENDEFLDEDENNGSFSLFSGDIVPRRSYTRTKKRKRLLSECSEGSDDEAEITQINKKKKNKKPKPEDKAAEEWAKSFNQMCQEVEEFPLVVE